MSFIATQEKIDKLLEEMNRLGIKEPERQHGRKGQVKENADDELTRRYHNLHSILYRAKKKAIYTKPSEENTDKVLNDAGISQIDLRRYKACFIWENMLPEIDYVRRMTGLNDYQILVLESYTKMKVIRHQPRVLED